MAAPVIPVPGLLAPSLLTAGIGTIGNLITSWFGNRRDKKMWDLQNAYNSPEAQMERLKKAGLNPNLVYGSGNVVGNSSGSRPITNVPNVVVPDIADIMSKTQMNYLRAAQEALTRKNIEVAETNRRLNIEKIPTEWSKQGLYDSSALRNTIAGRVQGGMYDIKREGGILANQRQRIENSVIMPLIAEKYGKQIASMVWELNVKNPLIIKNMGLTLDELAEKIKNLKIVNEREGLLSPAGLTPSSGTLPYLINPFISMFHKWGMHW